MKPGIYWCDRCRTVLRAEQTDSCPQCGHQIRYLTTDVRPVFARERRILQFYHHDCQADATVWKSSRSRYYHINGATVTLPGFGQLKRDAPAIADYIGAGNHYDVIDQQLIQSYQKQFKCSHQRLLTLEDEAFRFIEEVVHHFSRREILVSFSGGKDSTVVSSLVRRALGDANVLHIFGDTTLEDGNTYEYVRQFRSENPLIPFFPARAERDFYELVERMGPPSRVMRWCCTIFKIGPINDVLQSFDNKKVLTFYGIRRDESVRRSEYHKLSWNDPDRQGVVVKVGQDDESNGVTLGAKIGQQATASPIIDWTEFDVWNYIISYGLPFNKSYRLGFSRVGCWLCPLNSEWSEVLTGIFFPENVQRWRAQLLNFARRIGKPDPDEYIDSRGWVKRFGGAGLPNRFTGLETRPCGDMANAVQIHIQRPVNADLEEFLKPLGKINRDRSRPALGEIYLDGRLNQDWGALIVQAFENSTVLRFTVINPKQDMKRLTWYFKHQATKFQTCIQCTACSAVCPHGAITVKPDLRIYEIDQDICTGCMECVTHFDSAGCLVAKSLSVYGQAATGNRPILLPTVTQLSA